MSQELFAVPSLRRLSAAQHFALYMAFHRSLGNRILHAVFVPVILVTGAVFWTYLHVLWPVAGVLFATLACIDVAATLVFMAWILPGCFGALAAVHTLPWTVLVPVCAALHLTSWVGVVIVGHRIVEPKIEVLGTAESSNMFFGRGYFTGFNLGVAVTPLDRAIQAMLSPVALTHQLLVALGLRGRLEAQIERKRRRILAQLRLGQPPFEQARGLGDTPRPAQSAVPMREMLQ